MKTDTEIPARPRQEVPAAEEARALVRAEARRIASALDRGRPPCRAELEDLARRLLGRLELDADFLRFAMVAVSNEFWRDQFAAVPPSRRLLLLPHCLRDERACKGVYDARGLSCAGCGACALASVKAEGEALGYTVLIAEGTPAVVDAVLRGRWDAILGMACLESLAKAFSPVAAIGMPHVAVPLLKDGCRATSAEIGVLSEWLRCRNGALGRRTHTYVPILRAAAGMVERPSLDNLLAGLVSNRSEREDPAAASTEALGLEWLTEGGKRFRPFITLAGHAAAARDADAPDADAAARGEFPPAVLRVALAIEALHKASLVHDDIEDDDAFRYGRPTLHKRCGLGAALNVGDYLIGLGYRLVASAGNELGADAVVDVLANLSEAHANLCLGQGEEIFRTSRDPLSIRTEDVQRISALKTAPGFEAALYAGVRTARPEKIPRAEVEAIRRFSRLVGVAYQLINDLKDWRDDRHDKLVAGQDSLALRPTMLLALALEAGGPDAFRQIAASDAHMPRDARLERLRKLYEERGAFDRARLLLEKYRSRAAEQAAAAPSGAMRDLLRFILETVL